MNRLTQSLIGAFTALLWILVGGYLIWVSRSVGWQVAGGIAAALGLLRAIVVVQGLRETRGPSSEGRS